MNDGMHTSKVSIYGIVRLAGQSPSSYGKDIRIIHIYMHKMDTAWVLGTT